MNEFREAVAVGRVVAKKKLHSLVGRYNVPKRGEDHFKKTVMDLVDASIVAALAHVGIRTPDAAPEPEPVRDLVAEGRAKVRSEARAAGKAAGHMKALRIEPEPEPELEPESQSPVAQ